MKQSEVMRLKTKTEVFEFDRQLIKLYPEATTYETVKDEYDKTKLIEDHYSNAIHYDHVETIDNQYGLVFDRLDGQSLLKRMEDHPELMQEFATRLAGVHSELLKTKISNIQNQSDYYQKLIKGLKIKENIKNELLKLADILPNEQVLCHGDFQPDRVIMTKVDHTVIDFENAFTGHPYADIAKTLIILRSPRKPNHVTKFLDQQLNKMRKKYANWYLKGLDIEVNEDSELFKGFYKLAAASRLEKNESQEIEWLLSIIQN